MLTVLFPDLVVEPLVAQFDTPQLSSPGGAILLKTIDDRLSLPAPPRRLPSPNGAKREK